MPPVNCIIYKALVESFFSHGKKKSTRGDVCSGSTSRRLSTFSRLETLLICGPMVMEPSVHTGKYSSFPVAAQPPAAALRTHSPYALSEKQRSQQRDGRPTAI